MSVIGISAGAHDASVTVLEQDGIISFAGHAERYSKIKNDPWLNRGLIADAMKCCTTLPRKIAWYENPLKRNLRYIRAAQWNALFYDPSHKDQLSAVGLDHLPVEYYSHHKSHAAAGFYTSPFYEATVVVADAIGEFETFSVWHGDKNNKLHKIYSMSYPHSLGLFYSAFTKRVGLKPNEDEYILMGMAAFGEPKYADEIDGTFIRFRDHKFKTKYNLHRGVDWWRPELNTQQDSYDIAASVQELLEDYLVHLVKHAIKKTGCRNLILMGGVALNCAANSKLVNDPDINDMWVMPNPGDAGSSLGAAILANNGVVYWKDPYLGSDIPGAYPLEDAITILLRDGVVGIAKGRAEFGPRALGNRSLLADPRTAHMKDKVNEIKRRQPFRPFAPVILEEMVDQYFEMPRKGSAAYMQFVAKCKHPEQFPAIVHKDGTSRVQTVNKTQHWGLWMLLSRWFEKTGCPMLLNTSLNIKGQPLVNDRKDAFEFSLKYGIRVL